MLTKMWKMLKSLWTKPTSPEIEKVLKNPAEDNWKEVKSKTKLKAVPKKTTAKKKPVKKRTATKK